MDDPTTDVTRACGTFEAYGSSPSSRSSARLEASSVETAKMAAFVLVHGAGTGGCLWDDVARLLRAAGHQVSTPTLLGVGDQSTEDAAGITLTAHIDQTVQLVQRDHADPVILLRALLLLSTRATINYG